MKKIIYTKNAPEAIGPYSQGCISANIFFTSGQIGLDPQSGEIVKGGIREETKKALENIKEILKTEGVTLIDVVKTTVYLVDLSEFQEMNEIYSRFFKKNPPCRTTVQVAGLPKGARVEIEAVAIIES